MLRINGSRLHYIWLPRKFIHRLHIVDRFLVELSSWSSLGMSGIVTWKMPSSYLINVPQIYCNQSTGTVVYMYKPQESDDLDMYYGVPYLLYLLYLPMH